MADTGIKAAFFGRLGKDAELKTTRAGKPFLTASVSVDVRDSDDPMWVNCSRFDARDVETLQRRLRKGTRVYCEGFLSLSTWTDRDGNERQSLSCFAFELLPIGQISRRPAGRVIDTFDSRSSRGGKQHELSQEENPNPSHDDSWGDAQGLF